MLWILVGVAVLALVLFEFWPNKPGHADNGVSRIDGMDRIARSAGKAAPRVPRPRAARTGAAAPRLDARQRP